MSTPKSVLNAMQSLIDQTNATLESNEYTVHDSVMALIEEQYNLEINAPMLAASNSWYKGTTAKTSITSIDIVNSYAPTGSETESWNADVDNIGTIKCYVNGTKLTIAGNGIGKIYANPDSSYIFSGSSSTVRFNKVTKITGAELLDTSRVTTLHKAFDQDVKLESVDVSGWDVGNVTNMDAMFQACVSLKVLDLSKWNVSKVESMSNFFTSASSVGPMQLTSIGDLNTWDTSSCKKFRSFFQWCKSLRKLDLSGWVVSEDADVTSIFSNTDGLYDLTIGDGWRASGVLFPDTSDWYHSDGTKLTKNSSGFAIMNTGAARYIRQDPKKIPMLAPSNSWIPSDWVDHIRVIIFYDSIDDVDELILNNISTTSTDASDQSNPGQVTAYLCKDLGDLMVVGNGSGRIFANDDSSYLFKDCVQLTEVNGSLLDTLYVRDMTGMFSGCSELGNIDLSGFDTYNLRTTDSMFEGCSMLKTVNTTGWSTYNLESAVGMFAGCTALSTIDLNHLYTGNLKNVSRMFDGCKKLYSIGLNEWDTKNVENTSGMFRNVNMLELYIDKWNVHRITDMSSMFEGCVDLGIINLRSWSPIRLQKTDKMFMNCYKLGHMQLPNWYVSNILSAVSMFENCYELRNVVFGGRNSNKLLDSSSMFSNCCSLQSVTFKDGLTSIGDKAFFKCCDLTSISGLGNVSDIGDSAFTYASEVTDIDLDGTKVKTVGMDGSRLSNIDNIVDLSGVPLESVEYLGTRYKRWTESDLAAINAVEIPETVNMTPYRTDNQTAYPDVLFGIRTLPDGTKREFSVAEGACSAFTLFHIWNTIYAKDDTKRYDNFIDWFNGVLNTDGKFVENNDMTTSLMTKMFNACGWTVVRDTADNTDMWRVKDVAEFQQIVDSLQQRKPVFVSMYSVNNIASLGMHAIAIIGIDKDTRKLKIVDSSVYDTDAIKYGPSRCDEAHITWVRFEDIFFGGQNSSNNNDYLYFFNYNLN